MKAIVIFFIACSFTFANAKKDSSKISEFHSDEIIVVDSKFEIENSQELKLLESTEELLKSRNDVDFISRANFASEVMLNGYSQDRLNITIDGMRLFSACIDKMDPITSYIEVENIRHCEVSANKSDLSNGNSVGGGINFVTLKPTFDKGFEVSIENQFKSAADNYISKGKANYSSANMAALVSYSIKRASDYTAGGNREIKNSHFGKENAKLNLKYLQSENIEHGFEYIYDHSSDVGYPALIMDTRETKMNMLSYSYGMKNITSSILELDGKLYFNNISHLMDDYHRSVEEINSRFVMPGMYMPMDGRTQTLGTTISSKLLIGQDIVTLNYEAYKTNAFSDMKMESTTSDETMYLINLGDVETMSTGLAVSYLTELDENTIIKASGRIDYLNRELTNDFAKALTQSRWERNYSNSNIVINGAIGISHTYDELSEIDFTISRAERNPTHIEQYGYYIYNVADNSIYTGNPNLAKEASYSVNIRYSKKLGGIIFEADAFNDYLTNYIAGTIDPTISTNEGFGQQFKQFANIGNANKYGVGVSLNYEYNSSLSLAGKVKYQNSHSFRFDEPLPFTPPLSGAVSVSYAASGFVAMAMAEYASEQNNVSRTMSHEDTTPAYAIVNIRSSYELSKQIKLKLGVDNLLDEYYYTHFSVNNLPALGRNVYLGIVFGFE